MRLITRADLDGLTSAILLQEVEPIKLAQAPLTAVGEGNVRLLLWQCRPSD